MKNNPLVSIVVRTKDRPKLLRKAIQSIAGQTYRPIQVVLVNDGGCDLNLEDLQGILGNISLNYLKLETNTGRANAGNIGIENVQGKYLGFLDDDDEYYPEHLITLVSFLEQSDYDVAYTDSLMVYKEYNPQTHKLNDSVKREAVFSQDFIYDKLVFENYIPFMCLLFKRDLLVASGGFDNGFDLYEDWDLLIRIGRKHPFYHIKQVTANYNQWSVELQISQRNRDPVFMQKAYMKVVFRHIGEITPQRVHGMVSDCVRTRQSLKDLRNESESRRNLIRDQAAQIEALSVGIRERYAQVISLESELKERDARLRSLISSMAGKEADIISLKSALQDRETLIMLMKNTRGWQILEKYRKVRDRVIAIIDF